MAKKKKPHHRQVEAQTDNRLTLADGLGGDTLEKLKEAKQTLLKTEKEQEERRIAQKAKERREREKNMSFSELLEKYGDKGNKY